MYGEAADIPMLDSMCFECHLLALIQRYQPHSVSSLPNARDSTSLYDIVHSCAMKMATVIAFQNPFSPNTISPKYQNPTESYHQYIINIP